MRMAKEQRRVLCGGRTWTESFMSRHKVAREVVAGPGYRQVSSVYCALAEYIVYVTSKIRGKMIVNSPILVRMNRKKLVPMTGDFMRKMDKI